MERVDPTAAVCPRRSRTRAGLTPTDSKVVASAARPVTSTSIRIAGEHAPNITGPGDSLMRSQAGGGVQAEPAPTLSDAPCNRLRHHWGFGGPVFRRLMSARSRGCHRRLVPLTVENGYSVFKTAPYPLVRSRPEPQTPRLRVRGSPPQRFPPDGPLSTFRGLATSLDSA